LDFHVPAFFISGTVYENSTQSGVTVPYPSVELSFAFLFQPGASADGNVSGKYLLTVPIQQVTEGQVYLGTLTLSAFSYNSTTIDHNVTIGNDVTGMDFALIKAPTIPPSPSATIQGTVTGNAGSDLPFSYQKWYVPIGNSSFSVSFNTSSAVNYVYAIPSSGMLDLSVWGPEGTQGTMTMWIPIVDIPGPFTVSSIPEPSPSIVSQTHNSTYYEITIDYAHSSHTIVFQSQVIPEYSGPLLLVTMMTLVAAALIMLKKSHQMHIPHSRARTLLAFFFLSSTLSVRSHETNQL
jgi:hypothetical protein